MHLSSLYIDGYGPFEDSLIGELARGFNLVVTEDSDSARAVNDFIWSVLFGFNPNQASTASGGFLGFESDEGPVTVARYLHDQAQLVDPENGLVTVTGATDSLGKVVGRVDPHIFRQLLHIAPADIDAFHELIRFQIAETAAKEARAIAEAESAARQAAGIPDKPPTLEEVMNDLRTRRALQVARVENLDLSVRGVGRKLRGTRQRQARLRALASLRPTWNAMLELQRQMDELPRLPYLNDDPIKALETAIEKRSETASRLEAARSSESERRREVESITPSNEETALQREIEELLARRETHNETLETLSEVESDLHTEETNLRLELAGIRGDWSAERAREFAAAVTEDDLRQNEDVLKAARANLEKSEQAKHRADVAQAEVEASTMTAKRRLEQLDDVADADLSGLNHRVDTLHQLKATVKAIAGKKTEVARLQVRRTEARRLGSGVNRMLIMAQLGVTAAFAFVGFIVWVAAKIDGDGSVARTGLIMMGSGSIGILFALGFLWMQRRPSKRIDLREVQEAEDKRQQEEAKRQARAAEDPTNPIQKLQASKFWPIAVRTAQVTALILKTLFKLTKIAVARAYAMYRARQAAKAAAAEAQPEAEPEAVPASEPTEKRSFFSRFIKVERKAPAESSDEGEAEAIADEEEEEPVIDVEPELEQEQAKRSPFGIIELIGRFVQVKRGESGSDDEQDEAETAEDALLGAIAEELEAEEETEEAPAADDDEEEEEIVAAAVEEAEAEIPEEIREAQKRTEPKRGIFDKIAGLLHIEVKRPEQSEAKIVDEVEEEEVAKPEAETAPVEPNAEETPEAAEVAETPGEEDAEEVTAEASDESEEAEKLEETTEEAPEAEGGQDEEAAAPAADSAKEQPPAEDEEKPTAAATEEPAADESAESPAAEVESEDTPQDSSDDLSFEVGDSLGALDRSVAATSLEVEQLELELGRLLTVYAAAIDRPKAQFPPLTVEILDNELVQTERDIARHHEAQDHRGKLESLRTELEQAVEATSIASQQVTQARITADAAESVWADWLRRVNLPSDSSTEDVRELMRAVDPIRNRIDKIEDLRSRVDGLRSTTEDLETRVRTAAGDTVSSAVPIDSAFDAIERLAVRGRARNEKLEELADDLRTLENARRQAEADLQQAEARVQSYLDEVGAEDEWHFRELIDGAARRRALKDELERMRIDTPLLTGADATTVETDLRELSHERVEAELAELPDRIDRLQSQLSELQRDLADAEIELAGMPEIPEPLADAAPEAPLGGHVMPGALIRPLSSAATAMAVRYMRSLTGDKYSGLSGALSDDRTKVLGYKVLDREGALRDPDEEDSGAIFIALRMALIEEHAAVAGATPVVVADFTGSTNAAASQAAMTALVDLAERRQVICVTADAAAPARFAVLGQADRINLVDATNLESPFRSVVGGV